VTEQNAKAHNADEAEQVAANENRGFVFPFLSRPFSDIAAECERELTLWGRENVEKMYQKIKPG